jgi:rubrerythrin
MNIFEFAMQMEKDGENYYRRLAQDTNSEAIRTVLTMLADDEAKHFKAIARMQQASKKPQMADTAIIDKAKNIFAGLKASDEKFDFDGGQVELYRKAQQIEQKSRDFYLEKADETEQVYQKEIFLKLAEEEKKHFLLLDSLIQFVSRPQSWLENAEFYHLEDY